MNAGGPTFNSGGGAARGGGPACASCKYQRRKCSPDCVLAPFFPPERLKEFLNVHRLFGVSNVQKMIKDLNDQQKAAAMTSIIFQADARARDPVGGCYRIICYLRQLIQQTTAELEFVKQQIRMLARRDAVADLAATTAGDAGFNYLDYHGFQQDHFSMAQQPALAFPMPLNMMPAGSNPYENNCNILGHNYGNQQNYPGPSVQQHQQQNLNCEECLNSKLFFDPNCDDFRPEIIETFDHRHSPFPDTKDSFDCSTNPSAKNEEDPIEHVQENDLKGAASLFTLTNS